MDPVCVSVNISPPTDEKFICELSDSDHMKHPEDFKKREGFLYIGTENPCFSNPCRRHSICLNGYTDKQYLCKCQAGYTGEQCEKVILGSIPEMPAESCLEINTSREGKLISGKYWLKGMKLGEVFEVYCDMTPNSEVWTLIARFSNRDNKHWMNDTGYWWYDRIEAAGKTIDPKKNTDMISPAFWLVSGNEFKITRSDDSQHNPLLQTTGDCLGGQTFRSKVTSYGNFRNGKVWPRPGCLGNCKVQYGGQYRTTQGFEQAKCNGSLQSGDRIAFWCTTGWSSSVMMIGGGGIGCSGAGHGIGVTSAKLPSFKVRNPSRPEYDFSNSHWGMSTTKYALNVWMR